MEKKYGYLEIDEDMAFQERSWKAERAGWWLMALIALASILGLIDPGPLSGARKGDPRTLLIEYERFIHVDTPTQLHVRLSTDGPFSLQLPFRYLRNMEISHIVPEPADVASHDGLVIYSFAGRPGTADILFDWTVRKAGTIRGFVQSGERRIDFAQFVYP